MPALQKGWLSAMRAVHITLDDHKFDIDLAIPGKSFLLEGPQSGSLHPPVLNSPVTQASPSAPIPPWVLSGLNPGGWVCRDSL
ncbi:hypothetical protein Y1Q_0006916 [Alligator mississippiensis]|uniref:Uncharacterized protein n=1 Tax=Alligator mississippiensis TaxID=8496 RepID=A0A151MUG7_ALLMI|nr:hypothetical protein Y1Q_0006916 [Alligator mississippiensis]